MESECFVILGFSHSTWTSSPFDWTRHFKKGFYFVERTSATIIVLSKVGEEHPSILEAAHNLAAAVHEEQTQGAGNKDEERSTGGSYYLDEMSDEEMEEDGGAGPSRSQARARSSNSFNAITPAQLAQV